MSTNTCTHSRTWQSYDTFEDFHGEEYQQWTEHSECTTDDVDIHRYRCTQCGEIGYYSGAARRFYEDGEKTPGVNGLE